MYLKNVLDLGTFVRMLFFLIIAVHVLICLFVSLSGRRLTSQGTRDLDRIAGQVRNSANYADMH